MSIVENPPTRAREDLAGRKDLQPGLVRNAGSSSRWTLPGIVTEGSGKAEKAVDGPKPCGYNAKRGDHMTREKKIGIRELKNRTSRVIGEVREKGVDYVVTHRGEPVAVLRPWRDEDSADARKARAAEVLARIEATAGSVARIAGRKSAATAVSRQRR